MKKWDYESILKYFAAIPINDDIKKIYAAVLVRNALHQHREINRKDVLRCREFLADQIPAKKIGHCEISRRSRGVSYQFYAPNRFYRLYPTFDGKKSVRETYAIDWGVEGDSNAV